MNSLTTAENQQKLSEREIELGTAGTKNSWHNIYRESAWIFVGGLPFDLTEGDVICIFSQYGEIVNINMVRDKKTGKTKGYAFICYEDQRSTILAVDNFNTSKVLQRTIRVDHVKDYRPPDQDDKNVDDVTKMVRAEGVAPRPLTPSDSEEDDYLLPADSKEKKKKKKEKKAKKEKKLKKEKRDDVVVKQEAMPSPQGDVRNRHDRRTEIRERADASYDRHANGQHSDDRSSKYTSDDRSIRRTAHSDVSKRKRSGYDESRGEEQSTRNNSHRSGSPVRRREFDEGKGSRSYKRPVNSGERHRRSRSPSDRRSGRSRSRERRRRSRSPPGNHYK